MCSVVIIWKQKSLLVEETTIFKWSFEIHQFFLNFSLFTKTCIKSLNCYKNDSLGAIDRNGDSRIMKRITPFGPFSYRYC